MGSHVANPPSDLPPELRNHAQYEVLQELGRGNMGVVYLAENRLMGRQEVLKVINERLLSSPRATERFLSEIRSAARLSHPNIATAFAAFQAGSLMVFAMEYVPGDNLAQLVRSRGPLPVNNVCYYGQQVAQGLQHAFEKGLVHRDIKPQNLVLAREGKKHIVKILDFGLAKASRDDEPDGRRLTVIGTMMGTPDYVAPEQTLDAAKADIRADIYSLGCSLYFLLTGHAPFQAGSEFELLQAHHYTIATPLNQVRADVPPALAAIVALMMAKAPADRYQKPAEVAQALNGLIRCLRAAVSASEAVAEPQQAAQAFQGTLVEGPETIDRAREAAAATNVPPQAGAQPPLTQPPPFGGTRIESSATVERARQALLQSPLGVAPQAPPTANPETLHPTARLMPSPEVSEALLPKAQRVPPGKGSKWDPDEDEDEEQDSQMAYRKKSKQATPDPIAAGLLGVSGFVLMLLMICPFLGWFMIFSSGNRPPSTGLSDIFEGWLMLGITFLLFAGTCVAVVLLFVADKRVAELVTTIAAAVNVGSGLCCFCWLLSLWWVYLRVLIVLSSLPANIKTPTVLPGPGMLLPSVMGPCLAACGCVLLLKRGKRRWLAIAAGAGVALGFFLLIADAQPWARTPFIGMQIRASSHSGHTFGF